MKKVGPTFWQVLALNALLLAPALAAPKAVDCTDPKAQAKNKALCKAVIDGMMLKRGLVERIDCTQELSEPDGGYQIGICKTVDPTEQKKLRAQAKKDGVVEK